MLFISEIINFPKHAEFHKVDMNMILRSGLTYKIAINERIWQNQTL